ncbi:MAG: Tyramine--L-glutamate ligase [Methanoregula sp. SKADARSKE-2]|nr:MAG: Tyramine--L-glutamate ligase [Methanoregula sp. SKADARSKE-2]
MKVLLAEYTTAHDPVLAHEGRAMLDVLSASFSRCGYEVIVPGSGDFGEEIERLAPSCDMGLVIAPDHLLSRYTIILEQHTHNIGCGFIPAALCANKVRTGKILRAHAIPVPAACTGGRCVVKPVSGCGSAGVRLSESGAGKDEFSQEFIGGENLSVSLVGNRVVGEVCEYYSGKPPLVLAVNRQKIEIGKTGEFRYLGGETPVHPAREEEIIGTATKAATVLGCQGYCGVDVVVADRIYVVDVNPRITTSIVGIAACMEEEIAEILIAASKGGGPDRVHLKGGVSFDTQGKVMKL